MNAPQAKDTLRLPQFHNDWVEVTGFQQRKGGHQWPDAAEFTTDDYMKTAVVFLFREDHLAFKHAGFDLMGKVGAVTPPIDVLIQNDRVAAVRALDGTEHGVVRRDMVSLDPPLQIVTNALPAHNPENGDAPTPLAFVEPQAPAPRKSSDDGGNGNVPNKARLYTKMAQVMGRLQRIPKTGFNQAQNYYYVTDGDLYDAVRNEMAAANLALMVRIKGIRKEQEVTTYKDGNSKTVTTTLVDIDFTLACGDTGATETMPWTGSTNNPGDKAISAAVTIAEKYYLKATFIISTGDAADDPDSGIGEGESKASGLSKRKNPKQAAEDVQTGTAVIHFIEVRVNEDKNGKPYIVGEGGYISFTRQPFREGSIPCEDWEKPGKYTLPAPVLITYKVKGTGPKEITGAIWAEDIEAAPVAAKSEPEPDASAVGGGTTGTPPAVTKKSKASDLDRLPDEG